MGASQYNRGSAVLRRDIDGLMSVPLARAERDAEKDELARLREQIRTLERDLARARRCIAELRRSKDARLAEAREEQSRSDAAIRILTRIAFPQDHKRGAP